MTLQLLSGGAARCSIFRGSRPGGVSRTEDTVVSRVPTLTHETTQGYQHRGTQEGKKELS